MMSKFSLSRAHLFFVMNWPIFENPHSTTASAWGIITYIASKYQMATDTTQSLRRSSMVIEFFILAIAPSISVSSFLIELFVKYLFALSELFFKKFLLNFTLCSFYKPQVLATRHMENISNSNRWNTNVISFINLSMNGFIVEEWNSVLVIEASIQLLPCFTSSCTAHFNEQNSFNDIPRLFETFQMNWIYILIN